MSDANDARARAEKLLAKWWNPTMLAADIRLRDEDREAVLGLLLAFAQGERAAGNKTLHAELDRYGRHDSDCQLWKRSKPSSCSCGFSAVMEAAAEGEAWASGRSFDGPNGTQVCHNERAEAAEASAQRLTEALGKAMAVLDNPPGITFGEMARRNTEAWKILFDARAALDEAQKVKL